MISASISTLLRDLASCFVLLTRLPMPKLPDAAFARGAQAVWGYGIVGAVLGMGATLLAVLSLAAGLPEVIVAGLVLGVFMLTTGAMHEDGLADTADGFWGGQTAEKRLSIMKDSHIGSFGTLALIVVTGIRWAAVSALLGTAPAALIACAALSRACMPVVMHVLPPARKEGLAQGVGRPSLATALLTLGLSVVLAFAAIGGETLPALAACLTATSLVIWMAKRKIHGQTGDVLGSTQQICEAAALCTLVALTS